MTLKELKEQFDCVYTVNGQVFSSWYRVTMKDGTYRYFEISPNWASWSIEGGALLITHFDRETGRVETGFALAPGEWCKVERVMFDDYEPELDEDDDGFISEDIHSFERYKDILRIRAERDAKKD